MNIFGFEIADQTALMIGLAIIGVLVILVLKYRKKEFDYPRKDINVEAPKEFADMIKTSGQKIFQDKFMLYNGPIKLGRITAFTPWHFDSELNLKANLKNNKDVMKLRAQIIERAEFEKLVDNFYLFEVIKDTPIAKLLYIVGIGKNYHLVDQKAVTEGYKQYCINIYMQPQHYFKTVYIYSHLSKAIALNIADRITLKQITNGVINFVPKMDYIEMKTANYAAKAREYTDIKDKSWKKREENLEREVDQ